MAVADVGTNFPTKMQQRVRQYNLRDSYRLVVWAYACINAIADAASSVPLEFYDKPIDDPDRKKLPPDHEVRAVFNPPKVMEIPSSSELIRQIFINLGTFGEVFSPVLFGPPAFKNPNKQKVAANKPNGLDIKTPSLFTAVTDKDNGDLLGWEVEAGTEFKKKKIFKPGEIVQFKYYDPYNRYRGLAPLVAGRLSIEQEINMAVWNAGFFQGGVRNPIAIMLKSFFGTQKQRDDFNKNLKMNYGGFTRGQGPLVVEGGAGVMPLMNSFKDLDFVEGKSLTREEICALFGVPPAQVGIFRYASYANSREQTKLFWVNTNTPKMRIVRDVLQMGFINYHWQDVYIDFLWETIEALRPDPVQDATAKNLMASAANTLWTMGYKTTQIAELLENPLLANPEADKEEDPATPPDDAPEDPENPPEEDDEVDEDPEEDQAKWGFRVFNLEVVRSNGVLKWECDINYLEKYAGNYQKLMLPGLVEKYMTFANVFLKKMATSAVANKDIDIAATTDLWKRSITPMLQKVYDIAAAHAFHELDNPSESLSSFLSEPDRKDLHTMQSEKPEMSIKYFVDSSSTQATLAASQIKALIETSTNSGEDLRNMLVGVLADRKAAQGIVGRLYHHARLAAHVVRGVEKHRWASHKCVHKDHAALHNKEVLIWEDFSGTVGMHPMAELRDLVNTACTCTTFPSEVGAGDDESKEE